MGKQPLRRVNRFRWVIWLSLIAALVIGGRQLVVARQAHAVPVRVHKIERGQVRDLVTSVAAGRVGAVREVTLRAELGGPVLRLHHRRGDVVKAEEPLVTFDGKDLESRLRLAELAVSLGRAQAAQTVANASVVGSNAARLKLLQEAGAAPVSEADNLLGQYLVALKSSDVAAASVAQGIGNVEIARIALRKATVKAPFSGIVLSTSVEEGDVALMGTPLLSLADASVLHVDADMDEADIARIEVGMSAEIALDAFPDRLHGNVIEIAPSVTRDLRGNRSVAVKVRLPSDPRLKVGMSADVDVVVARRDNVAWVPPTAVLGRGAERSVYVVEGDVARRRRIEVGISTWEAVEVVKGVEPGDRVVVTLNAAGLADGARVKVEGEAADHGTRVGMLSP